MIPRLTHPIADPALRGVTQHFAENPAYYAGITYDGVPLRGHNGVDFGCPTGTRIQACDAGTVIEACEDTAMGMGYGIYVKLRHAWGESLYAHLACLDVGQGDSVRAGDVLGNSDNTGNTTGPHLHFAVRINPYNRRDGWGGFSDPEPLLAGQGDGRLRMGFHFQGKPSAEMVELIDRSPDVGWVKLMDPPAQNPFHRADLQIIGRVYVDDAEANRNVTGSAGGDWWYERCKPAYDRAGYITWWEYANESPVNDIECNRWLAMGIARWTDRMHARALKVIAPVIAVGNPGGTAAEMRARVQALQLAFRIVDGWAYHGYWLPEQGPEQWYALRYRMIVGYLQELGIQAPALFITEALIDGGCDGKRPGKGWVSLSNLAQVSAQAATFEGATRADGAVCWTPFTASPNRDWVDFAVERHEAEALLAAVRAVPGAQPPAVLPPAIVDVAALVRAEAWRRLGVPYNPDAALARAARTQGLGRPVTPEFDVDGRRAQGYDGGIVHAPLGQWDAVDVTPW